MIYGTCNYSVNGVYFKQHTDKLWKIMIFNG